ncbi:MAG: anaerobic carbon-monoxide dehydrogenase catalytic subunit [Candidatus Omnitrophota bacterium]
MATTKEKSFDPASCEMIEKARRENINIVWDRLQKQQPQCGFGRLGICCSFCNMGPCRIDPFDGNGPNCGVCGANQDTIAARNLARKIAAGCAAHSDHGRDVAHTLALAAEGKAHDYQVTDEAKLKEIAQEMGLDINRDIKDIAGDLGKVMLAEFGKPCGEQLFSRRAPKKRREIWARLGITPRAIYREVVETMHATNMGVDNDLRNLMLSGMRAALADGWGGSMIATDIQDILLGNPEPIRSQANLGVLKKDFINVAVHGHEPVLSEMAVKAAADPELMKMAREKGAEGINLVGICCTANEILMRHGMHIAGNFLQQELAVVTGAVEVLMVDVQCIMPSLREVVSCFHTKLVTTNPKARFPGVLHIEFNPEQAYDTAKKIIRLAIDNFPNRDRSRVNIPGHKMDLVAGFTRDVVFQILGGRYRSSYRPLNEAIISGRLRGLAGVVGCNNPKQSQDYFHIELTKELLKKDVLVLQTGCAAIGCGKAGLLKPEAAKEYAGKGLQEICEAVGIPPVLHLGACVDNSRILTAACEIIKEGGLGEDLSDIPAAGCAPEWMSEKAITIGFYFVASGVYTVFGSRPFPVFGSPKLTDYLTKDMEKDVGAKFAFAETPQEMANLMLAHIDKKRQALNLAKVMYE